MQHKLLIVDDEPMIYHALRRALHREQDWETVYAESGDAALEILESQHIDVIVSDENMPGMSGSQLLSLVRQRFPDVIRMMLTGDPSLDVVVNAVNNGEIYRFFTKPCNEAELIIAIRDALQMSKLKAESRRLLDLVKQQQARIRMLEAKGGPLPGPEDDADAAPAADDAPRADAPADVDAGEDTDSHVNLNEDGSLSLDSLSSQAPPAQSEPAPMAMASAPSPRSDGVIDLSDMGSSASDERGDVDVLLNDIRDQLDDILR